MAPVAKDIGRQAASLCKRFEELQEKLQSEGDLELAQTVEKLFTSVATAGVVAAAMCVTGPAVLPFAALAAKGLLSKAAVKELLLVMGTATASGAAVGIYHAQQQETHGMPYKDVLSMSRVFTDIIACLLHLC